MKTYSGTENIRAGDFIIHSVFCVDTGIILR